MVNLSSSFDHRVVDGQQAAEFVQALRRYLECPALLFVYWAPRRFFGSRCFPTGDRRHRPG
jgi:hypothetical protein